MRKGPNYYRIYTDLIREKFPDQANDLLALLPEKAPNSLEVIQLNERIFEKKNSGINQKLRAYDEQSIETILKHQIEYGLNNCEIAQLFNLSRNTITKWKSNSQYLKEK